jgi:hypothetical protein
LLVPNRKHITSPLWAQQINGICWFVTMVYTNITITILDIIHCPVVHLKHDVSETLCLRHQVVPTQLGPPKIETSSFYWAHLRRFHMQTDTESSLQNVVF